jgi:hypothetical protein
MSDCLHCDINQLVQEHIERGNADLGGLAFMMVESLADLILRAPETEQANLMADRVETLVPGGRDKFAPHRCLNEARRVYGRCTRDGR